jgi:hypothetical protein
VILILNFGTERSIYKLNFMAQIVLSLCPIFSKKY